MSSPLLSFDAAVDTNHISKKDHAFFLVVTVIPAWHCGWVLQHLLKLMGVAMRVAWMMLAEIWLVLVIDGAIEPSNGDLELRRRVGVQTRDFKMVRLNIFEPQDGQAEQSE